MQEMNDLIKCFVLIAILWLGVDIARKWRKRMYRILRCLRGTMDVPKIQIAISTEKDWVPRFTIWLILLISDVFDLVHWDVESGTFSITDNGRDYLRSMPQPTDDKAQSE
jgi:hypothetical protein